MNDKPSSIRNLGPASDAFFKRAGLETAEQIRDLGPDESYYLALKSGGRPHFIGYYAMVMGLQGRPWSDCQGSEKDQLKERFDAIKARLSARKNSNAGIEKALNALGVVQKP